jgi:hypothetical protein
MIFMMINGCKMDNSESISIGNQINSSLASKKRSGFADYFGKGNNFVDILDKYDGNISTLRNWDNRI